MSPLLHPVVASTPTATAICVRRPWLLSLRRNLIEDFTDMQPLYGLFLCDFACFRGVRKYVVGLCNVWSWKGGKGLGAKCRRKVLLDNIQGIVKPSIRCLARCGAAKRISGLISEETLGVLKVFSKNTTRDTVTYNKHAKRKTVTAMDVIYALKRQGCALYGFGG
ncbi:histone H4-like [Scleropages formosus]|uniref:Histone H4 n=1 Tax=Scleropages formosus TaxID=113540 RepID=A0A0P7UT08_SCLFO|nr:histone H4-like [Scleropages formosus]